MWLYTRGAANGRNFYDRMYSGWGSVIVRHERVRSVLTIRNGEIITKVTTDGRGNRTVLHYGKEWLTYRHGKLSERIPYRAGSNQARAHEWYRLHVVTRQEPLYPKSSTLKGTRVMAWHGHSLAWERFTYANGREA